MKAGERNATEALQRETQALKRLVLRDFAIAAQLCGDEISKRQVIAIYQAVNLLVERCQERLTAVDTDEHPQPSH